MKTIYTVSFLMVVFATEAQACMGSATDYWIMNLLGFGMAGCFLGAFFYIMRAFIRTVKEAFPSQGSGAAMAGRAAKIKKWAGAGCGIAVLCLGLLSFNAPTDPAHDDVPSCFG